MRSWQALLVHMNTLLAMGVRTPPVLILQNIAFDVPGLTDSARVEVYVDQELVFDSSDDVMGSATVRLVDGRFIAENMPLFICGDVQVKRVWRQGQ